jgi:hypothetical protein
MVNDLQTWWQNTTPEVRTPLEVVSVVAGALLIGHFLATLVARTLRARNFDAFLRVPGAAPRVAGVEGDISPTLIAALLVRLSIAAGAVWWLAFRHEQFELARTLGLIISRTWTVAAVLVAALALGSFMARRLIECLPPASPETAPSRNGTAVPRFNAAGIITAGTYGLVVLLVLLIAADLCDWPLTRTSALALWQLTHHLLVAGAALFIGFLGSRWARELVTPESLTSPEKRAAQYTALGITAATTLLAVAVLLSSAGVLIGLAALAILGFLLWLIRGYLPDVAAGLQLRAHKIREVWFDGVPWQVAEVGVVTTQVTRNGEFCRVQNRVVLEARLHAAPVETAQHGDLS